MAGTSSLQGPTPATPHSSEVLHMLVATSQTAHSVPTKFDVIVAFVSETIRIWHGHDIYSLHYYCVCLTYTKYSLPRQWPMSPSLVACTGTALPKLDIDSVADSIAQARVPSIGCIVTLRHPRSLHQRPNPPATAYLHSILLQPLERAIPFLLP